MDTIKCVVVGDGAVGKTSMLISYASNRFPTDYVPTIFDNYAVNLIISGEPYVLGLFDTAGQEEYDRLRVLAYPSTNVFLICFSVTSRTSFENVREQWAPEIKHYCAGVPFVLVGTQSDLRGDPHTISRLARNREKMVSEEEAQKLAKQLKAVTYVECSALTQKGLKNVFDEAILAYLNGPTEDKDSKKSRCVIL